MIELRNQDCEKGILNIPDKSIDCILTDPPYLYLKKQKLEREFNEVELFKQFKRVLKPDGFVVLFGRGTSFYRWNTILADLGFNFKEEIIWDKGYITSPLMHLSRIHETISIFNKGKGSINKVKVPYLEMKKYDIPSIITDIKRLKTTFHNPKSLQNVQDFLDKNIVSFNSECYPNYTSVSGRIKIQDRSVAVAKAIKTGMAEKSIIRTDWAGKVSKNEVTADNASAHSGDRCVNVTQSITFGMNEKSIIKQAREHYTAIHPTQKPVRLLERLLALVSKKNDLILDPFAGSASTGVACLNTNRNFIGFEIDKEYYDKAYERLEKEMKEHQLQLF